MFQSPERGIVSPFLWEKLLTLLSETVLILQHSTNETKRTKKIFFTSLCLEPLRKNCLHSVYLADHPQAWSQQKKFATAFPVWSKNQPLSSLGFILNRSQVISKGRTKTVYFHKSRYGRLQSLKIIQTTIALRHWLFEMCFYYQEGHEV